MNVIQVTRVSIIDVEGHSPAVKETFSATVSSESISSTSSVDIASPPIFFIFFFVPL